MATPKMDAPWSADAALRTGQPFTMWTLDPASGLPRSSRVLLFLREGAGYGRAGTLFWSVTHTLTEMPSQRLLLHMIIDMQCGKLSQLFLAPSLAERVADTRCFTLRSGSMELNLEAPSHEQRELWWHGVLRKLQQGGRALLNHQPPSSVSSPASTLAPTPQSQTSSSPAAFAQGSPHSSTSSASSLASPPPHSHSPPSVNSTGTHESTPEELRALLHGGVLFRRWELVPDAQDATKEPQLRSTLIVLFAEGSGRSGSIYWLERDPSLAPGAAITATERTAPMPSLGSPLRLPLDAISDFMLRKKAPALRASPAPLDCCFALVCSATAAVGPSSLCLEAFSAQQCKMTKEALITMLTNSGKQMVRASAAAAASVASSTPPSAVRAISPAQSLPSGTPKQAAANGSLSTPKTGGTSSSSLAAVAVAAADDSPLAQGARFMLYSCPDGASPSAAEVFVWLAAPDQALGVDTPGALCYSILSSASSTTPPQQRFVHYPGQRFALAALKQMQIGRDAFRGLTLATLGESIPSAYRHLPQSSTATLLHPACCFSIVFKAGVLHLEALAGTGSGASALGREREPIREAVIRSLHETMLQYTKARKAAAAASLAHGLPSTPSSATSLTPLATPTRSLPVPSHDASSSDIPHPSLLAGLEFLLYLSAVGQSGQEDVNVFPIKLALTADVLTGKYALAYTLDANSPTSVASAAAGAQMASQQLALSTIQRLVAGKSSPLLKSSHPAVKDLPADRCLSIMARHATWHLEAPSHEQREHFMKNLHQCMLKFRKTGASQATPSPANISSSIAPASVSTELDFLSRGHACRMYRADPSGEPALDEVTMYFEPVAFSPDTLTTTPGILFFASHERPPLSSVSESRRIYLNRMSQLVGGKETEVLRHPTLRRLQLDRCFSIHFTARDSAAAGSAVEWNIECASHGMREQWIQSIHSLMVAYGRQKSEYKASLAASAAAAAAVGPSPVSSAAPRPSPSQQNLRAVTSASPSSSSADSSSSSLSIDTDPVMRLASRTPDGPSPTAMMGATMVLTSSEDVGETKVFHAEGDEGDYSPSTSPVDQSSDSSDSTSPPTPLSPVSPTAGAVAASAALAAKQAQQKAEIEAATTLLEGGHFFALFASPAVASSAPSHVEEPPTRTDVFLFFQAAVGGDTPGSLFWQNAVSGCEPAVRKIDPNSKFLLNTIKQMRAGKDSAVLQSALARDCPNECCMTLVNSNVQLNLVARDTETRDVFMRAVHAIVVRNGMRAAKEEKPATPQTSTTVAAASHVTHHHKSHSHPASLGVGGDRAHRLDPSALRMVSDNTNATINYNDPTSFFLLQTKIGEGSYGSVYKALDLRDGKACAVKIISFSGVDSTKLRNEIRMMKGCNSPHVLAYKGAFQKNEYVWLVMDHCEGGSLSDMMHACRHTFSENQIACIMKQTLLGLAYLHKRTPEKAAIIHRDIKGGNILVTRDGRCLLADFGVSVSLDQSLGKHRTVLGTPHWMAPEVLLSDNYNELVDIWSLGVTAYELAVGQPPHAELHSLRAALKIPMCEPPTLPHPERYSPELHSFLRSCLVKDYTRRPSAEQLLAHPFITRNTSTPALLLEMVARTRASVEAKAAADGEVHEAALQAMAPSAKKHGRSTSSGDEAH